MFNARKLGVFRVRYLIAASLLILLISSNVFSFTDEGNRYGIDPSTPPYTTQNTFCPTNCGQCTAFAYGRALDRLGIQLTFSQTSGRHACTWPNIITNSNVTKVYDYTQPRRNSLVVWASSTDCDDNHTGHVAYVEEVDGNYVYINEANIATYTPGNYGGGYDGYTKKFSISELSNRPSAGGEFKAYIYLDSSFSDYHYWDFDTEGTEDWNARQALNQGIVFDDFWQLGSSFGDNSQRRGIVSPILNSINTATYNAIEIPIIQSS